MSVNYFGANFKQDINNIYITKSDLPLLIPKINNSAQSLLVALLLKTLNQSPSLINVSVWRTFFGVLDTIPVRFVILLVQINVPIRYKYINVEITNANDD